MKRRVGLVVAGLLLVGCSSSPPVDNNAKACADWNTAFLQNTDEQGSVNVVDLSAGLDKASHETAGAGSVPQSMYGAADVVPVGLAPGYTSAQFNAALKQIWMVQDACAAEGHSVKYTSLLTR